MPIVYVIQAPTNAVVNLSTAKEFGELKIILATDAWPSVKSEEALENLRAALKDFRKEDYILFAGGDPAAAFLAGLVLPETYEEPIQWLRYDRGIDGNGHRTAQGHYTPTSIDY